MPALRGGKVLIPAPLPTGTGAEMAFPKNTFVRHQWRPSPPGVINLSGAGLGRYPIEGALRDPQRLAMAGCTSTPFGYLELREVISSRYGVPVSEVFVTQGAAQANFMALCALTSPGDRVCLEFPVYESFRGAIEGLGCEVIPLERRPEGRWLPDLDALATHLTTGVRVVMLSDPMNPAGVMMTPADFSAIASLCADHGATLLVDEIFQDFYQALDGSSGRPSHRVGHPNVVATSSLSKVYGLGDLHLGWMLGPEALLDRAWEAQDLTSGGVPSATQALGLLAFEECDAILEWAARRMGPNLEALGRFKEAVPLLEWDDDLQASIAFPRLPGEVDGGAFCQQLLDEGQVRVVPGRFFGLPQGFRIALGAPLDDFRRGLSRLGRCLKSAL